MKTQPLPPVSVVIPVYNHEKYVIQALESVLQQTHPSLEIILIDDGSKDKSPALIEEYLKTYVAPAGVIREILFKIEKNKGAHATINQGISLAKHHHIAILNSDDYFALERLEVLVKEMVDTHAKLAFSEVTAIDENGKPLPPSHHFCQYYDMQLLNTSKFPSVSFGFLMANVAISTGNFVFTRDLFDEVGPFSDFRHAHDYDFLLKAVALHEPAFIRKGYYYYRMHSSNTITQDPSLTKAELGQMLPEFLIKMLEAPPKNVLAPSPWNFQTEFAQVRSDSKIDRYLSKYLIQPEKQIPKPAVESITKRKNGGHKVALITHTLSFSGAPKVVYDMAQILLNKGYQPVLFSMEDGPLKSHFEKLGIAVTLIPKPLQANHHNSFATKLCALFFLYFYLLWKLPHRIIVNSFSSRDVGIAAGFMPFKKKFWFIHESLPPGSALPRGLLSRAMKVLQNPKKFTFMFGSKSTKELWQRSGIDGEVVYWSGLPATTSKATAPRPIKNILAMGSIEVRKGTHTLVEAFIQCIREKRIPDDVVLTIIGFPDEIISPYQGNIVLRVLKEKLQDRIKLVKSVPMEQVDPYFEAADLFVMASSNECLPLVLLNAMSKGLPIITTTAYGCAEAIEEGVTGYTCPPLNPNTLADKIEIATKDYTTSWEMAARAQRKFNEQFAEEHNATRFMEVFENK
jgi:glycosyltransferase involved in cell wall biosynthesis